jgi:uncharacterized protein YqhQ
MLANIAVHRLSRIALCAAPLYGGQAVLEGVMMRGRRYWTVAVRAPDDQIVVKSERLPSRLYGGWVSKTPFVRGMTALWDALVLGMKALMFSADVLDRDPNAPDDAEPSLSKPMQWGSMAVALLFGIAVFFLLPLGAAGVIEWWLGSELLAHTVEAVLRAGLVVAYVWAIGFLPEIRRVYGYHGAEHMSIHALENRKPLEIDQIRPFSTIHPRCGTAFLMLVVLVSIVFFALVGTPDWWIRIASRIVGIPIIAAVAYEVLKLGARFPRNLLLRAIIAPGLLLQRVTTRRPDDSMIEVAAAALTEVVRLEGEPVAA